MGSFNTLEVRITCPWGRSSLTRQYRQQREIPTLEQTVQLEFITSAIADDQQKPACTLASHIVQYSRPRERLHGGALLQYAHRKATMSHGAPLGMHSVSPTQIHTRFGIATSKELLPSKLGSASRILER